MPLVGLAVFLHPGHGLGEFFLVVDAEVDTAQNFHQRHIFRAHAKIVLQEVGVDDGARDAHAGVAEREIGLAAHGGHGLGGLCKAENLFGYVGGDGVVVEVLHVMTVDAEGGKPLLCMGGQHCGKVDGSWTLRPVESPHGLGIIGVHVHGFRTIAPT